MQIITITPEAQSNDESRDYCVWFVCTDAELRDLGRPLIARLYKSEFGTNAAITVRRVHLPVRPGLDAAILAHIQSARDEDVLWREHEAFADSIDTIMTIDRSLCWRECDGLIESLSRNGRAHAAARYAWLSLLTFAKTLREDPRIPRGEFKRVSRLTYTKIGAFETYFPELAA